MNLIKKPLELNTEHKVIATIGDYTISHDEDAVYLTGVMEINLSAQKRTAISITVRTGLELSDTDFFKDYYNIDKNGVYFTVGMTRKEEDGEVYELTFVFDEYQEALDLQFMILSYKSMGFFGTLEEQNEVKQ